MGTRVRVAECRNIWPWQRLLNDRLRRPSPILTASSVQTRRDSKPSMVKRLLFTPSFSDPSSSIPAFILLSSPLHSHFNRKPYHTSDDQLRIQLRRLHPQHETSRYHCLGDVWSSCSGDCARLSEHPGPIACRIANKNRATSHFQFRAHRFLLNRFQYGPRHRVCSMQAWRRRRNGAHSEASCRK